MSIPAAIVVSADAQSNVISVVYARRMVRYMVRHCEWGTDRQLAQSTKRMGAFGEAVLAGDWQQNIPGYAYHSCDPASGLVLGGGSNILTLYYAADPAPKVQYKVEYFYDGKCDGEATLMHEAAVGEVISTYPDKSKAGYRFVRDTCTLAVGADSENNVIRVYYERIKENPRRAGKISPEATSRAEACPRNPALRPQTGMPPA